ncbi:MAG: DMT family transporter [Myxococcota bacterium]|nr:DMT family transporter [Myxococcota bacterium]
MSRLAIVGLVLLALIGFAANSLLCRAALGAGSIDAASFTAIRIASGALILIVLSRGKRAGSWASAFALFAYAAAFSFAYLRLVTATGALILFATVQATMIGVGVARGERPTLFEWLGFAIAIAGLVVLVLPGLASPDPIGAVLMAIAGASWGIYSLRGRGATNPLAVTADNFLRAVPMAALLLLAIPFTGGSAEPRGIALAIASGAIASGIGYTLWYAALPSLAAVRAAIVQLSVPVLAAASGALVLHETVTLRLAVATGLIIGGIALALLAKRQRIQVAAPPHTPRSHEPAGQRRSF